MRENGRTRLARAEKNEQAHKEHNERRARLEEEAGFPQDERVPFVCECDDASCAHAVVMHLDEYEQAVTPPDQFVVRPGHEDPAVERIVERHDEYIIVSKPDLKRRQHRRSGH
jgi:hypothetical protein